MLAIKLVKIIQISDLHFGSEFRSDYFDNVVDFITKNKPDALICTGDIVHKGRYAQYNGFVEYFERLKNIGVPLLMIPGNHDVKNNGLIFFERFIAPRRSRLLLEEQDTIIVGLCSAKDDVSIGEITDEQLAWLARQFNKNLENRVIALHHHVIAVPYSGRKNTTLLDAGELIELTQIFEVDLVIMGHKHIPHAYVIGPTTFLYCGTSTSNKVRADESPSFNLIELDDQFLEIYNVDSDSLKKNLLLTRKNSNIEFIRPRKTRIEHLINSKLFKHYKIKPT